MGQLKDTLVSGNLRVTDDILANKINGVTVGNSPEFTDTKVTSVGNHYTPTTDSGAAISASATGATAAWSIDVVKGVTLSRDAKGHVTGISVTSGKIPANPNTDRYVNSAAFADDSTNTAASPVKMTLTRAGSDTATVTANIPKVSSSSAGVAPKGAAVSSQSQSTKFLREDGTWAAPSYTTNTNTAQLQVSDTTNKRINTKESTGKYIQFSGGTNKFTVSDGTNSFDVGVTPSITCVTGVKGNSESNYRTGNVNLTCANIGAATSDHTHGNIQNGGALQANDITIASGDKLVVTDSSDSSKIARTSVSFDGSTTTKALTQKGTFETFLQSHQTLKTVNSNSLIGSGNVSVGTVTSVATGVGLTGGTITSTGTLKAKLKEETLNASDSVRSTSSDGGLYAVEADKSGNLSVRVPWKNTTYTVNNGQFSINSLVGSTETTIGSSTANQSGNSKVVLVQGTNITLTPDATNNKITIASTYTDSYVNQSDTSTTNWRKVILSFQNGSEGAAVSNNTNVVYGAASIEAQPSSGTLKANVLRAANNNVYVGSASGSQCHQQYDTTNKCLKFIFD